MAKTTVFPNAAPFQQQQAVNAALKQSIGVAVGQIIGGTLNAQAWRNMQGPLNWTVLWQWDPQGSAKANLPTYKPIPCAIHGLDGELVTYPVPEGQHPCPGCTVRSGYLMGLRTRLLPEIGENARKAQAALATENTAQECP